MKRKLIATLILMLGIAVMTAFSQPRNVERYSTDPGKDLKRTSVTGKITKIEGQRAVLKTEDGRKVTVHLGPQRYWRDKGYHLESGAHVTVDGWGEVFDDDGGFLYAGGIYGDGYSIELMNSRGYPMWADPEEWDDDWYPSYSVFELYFGAPWGHGPWGYWGPPPRWWHRPHRGHYGYGPRPGWHDGPYGPPRPQRGYGPRPDRHDGPYNPPGPPLPRHPRRGRGH